MFNPPLRTVAVVIVLVVTAGCLGAIGSGDDPADGDEDLPDADALLENATSAEASIETVQGEQTVTITDGDESVATTHEVWQRGTDQYRAEVVDSDDPEPIDVTVTDGNTTWLYDADENEALQATFDFDESDQEAFDEEFVEGLYADMDAEVTGTDTVADRETYVLELEADGEDAVYESATLWIDQETNYPLKQETETSLGEMTTTVEFESVTFDEPIDDEVFTFEVPEDATVRDFDDFTFEQYDDIESADAVVPFELPEPEVPDEYALETAMVTENMVGWSASLQYAEGDSSEPAVIVTVADDRQEGVFEPEGEPVEIGDTEGVVREVFDGEQQLEWETDGLSYTVSGELEEAELIAIAESMLE